MMTQKKTLTVTVESAEFYNLPEWQETPGVDGLTVREVLCLLRSVPFGNIGTAHVQLSDGTALDVELCWTDGGNSRLINSQRAVRRDDYGYGVVIRTYDLGN